MSEPTQPAPSIAPRRNVEIKARHPALDAACEVARRVATAWLGQVRQVDTYFHCRAGRLKLRETSGQAAQLVAYERPNTHGPKTSRYRLVEIADGGELKAALTATLGVCCVVDKTREIFLRENVRIHLDDVRGLGTFIEFEAVLDSDADEAAGRRQVDWLRAEFGLTDDALVPASYGDLLAQRSRD